MVAHMVKSPASGNHVTSIQATFQALPRWLLAAGAKLRRCGAISLDASQHAKSKLVQVVDLDLGRLLI